MVAGNLKSYFFSVMSTKSPIPCSWTLLSKADRWLNGSHTDLISFVPSHNKDRIFYCCVANMLVGLLDFSLLWELQVYCAYPNLCAYIPFKRNNYLMVLLQTFSLHSALCSKCTPYRQYWKITLFPPRSISIKTRQIANHRKIKTTFLTIGTFIC